MQVSIYMFELDGVEHTDIGATALEDERAVDTQDPAQIFASPQSGRTHGLNQVGASQQGNVDALLLAGRCLDASQDLVQLVVEVVQYLDRWHVLFVERLPRVHANPG